jgi:hypothetical protein
MLDVNMDINKYVKSEYPIPNAAKIIFPNDISMREFAHRMFENVAPGKNHSILLSSEKNYNVLKNVYDTKDAENGIHVLRSYLAHVWYHNQHQRKVNLESQEFYTNGYYIRDNFLPEKEHAAVRDIVNSNAFPFAVHKGPESMVSNSTTLQAFVRRDIVPIIQRTLAVHDAKIEYMIAESTFVQKLHNKPDDGDVQKVLHSDTFFPALKFWYFPNTVTWEDGPFVFIPDSCHFDDKMAQFILEQSIKITKGDIEDWRTYGHAEGSLRTRMEECSPTFTQKGTLLMDVPANTLLVANVFGFHARGKVSVEAYRNAIHGSVRTTTPFLY